MSETVFIVTGAAGHLGSHVVKELLEQDKEVRALVLPNESCPDFIDANRHLLKEYAGNVCIPETIEPLFDSNGVKEFVVIHCAGIVTIDSKKNKKVYDVNVGGTANIIAACERHSVKRLIYISSVHAIPLLPHGQIMSEISCFSPDTVIGYYGKTKAIATQLVLDAVKRGLDAVVIHPTGIIGPHSLPTGNMAQAIQLYLSNRLPAAIRGGFDFVDVRDVAGGIIAAADKGRSGECYILSNIYVEIEELFKSLSEVSGQKKLKFYLPVWAAKAAALFAEMYYQCARKTPVFTLYSLHTLSENSLYSHDKASRELGYNTRPLKETLTDIVSWTRSKGA